ncbi:hypothetical protein N7539_008816 [Penicillium diatomitis]|uniref:Uncharacterized protein n=1 Tax=Penicillium diatomitis TaxID=2819901 RepID=A0A9W9WR94_9EURO|nr:uncharacterized protein N7539_008816 [Penicillium diatomitis]KAJ5471873.1 hypothetical protein N7539_008816 [Penicillium diatomitis]
MSQGLTGAPETYARMKDLAMGKIPEPYGEQRLSDGDAGFEYYMDDDMGAAMTVMELLVFLYDR